MSRATSPLTVWIENIPMEDDPKWAREPTPLRTPCPYRRVRRGDPIPKGAVFLRPDCGEGDCGEGDCGIEREWCVDDVWERCEEWPCRARSVAYRPMFDAQMRLEDWR